MKKHLSRLKAKVRKRKGEPLTRKQKVRKYWYVFVLLGIFLTSLWLRSIPGRWNELIGLDEFLLYRVADYTLHNSLQIYDANHLDMMRYSPLGVSTWHVDYSLPMYLPVLSYLFFSAVGMSMPFFEFAIFFPALLGAVGAIMAFFIAKELFKNNISGLFAAFFVSMTPALYTRTSAASFEKEATAVIFMMAAIWLFIKAYKRHSLRSGFFYGSLSGVSLGLMGLAWGGVQYIYLLFASFFGVLFMANVVIVVLDYLFSGLGKHLDNLERFLGPSMIAAYVPMIIIGTLIPQFTPHNIGLSDMSSLAAYAVAAVLLARHGVARLGLVRKEKVRLVIPGMLALGAVSLLLGVMFTGFFDSYISNISGLLVFNRGIVGSTVAENAPGDWGTIISTLGTGFSSGLLPQLNSVSWLFSLYLFMFLGVFVLLYEFYRTRNWMLLFPLVWLVSTIWSVFLFVRLLFVVGPVAGIVGGFFFGWMIERLRGTRFMKSGKKGLKAMLNFVTVPLAIFLILLVIVNAAGTYVYAMSINTAICFPKADAKGNIIPCVTVDENGNEILNEDGQPWYQAMNFLSQKTPEGSVILSWWDFGYWFQTRGHRPSVADGGNLGGIYLRNFELADWYMDRPENWSGWVPWMKGYNVSYIFMDYTLPGKYGAISKIGSRGEKVYGFLEFQRSGMYPKDNVTIVEYTNNPYALWLPFDSSGNLVGAPTFLVMQNGKYYSKSTINDVCTTSGIVRVANDSSAMPGCVAMSHLGIFYVPAEIEHTIFNSLMFMQGHGLPVEKVFDNTYIQIYKVNYEQTQSVG